MVNMTPPLRPPCRSPIDGSRGANPRVGLRGPVIAVWILVLLSTSLGAQDITQLRRDIEKGPQERRITAIKSLLELFREIRATANQLGDVAGDRNQSVSDRLAAIEAIEELSTPFALDRVHYPTEYEWQRGLWKLQDFPPSVQFDLLLKLAHNQDEPEELRIAAIEAMYKSTAIVNPASVKKSFLELLRDSKESESVRGAALAMLAIRPAVPTDAAEILITIASDRDEVERLRLLAFILLSPVGAEYPETSVMAIDGLARVVQNRDEPLKLRREAMHRVFYLLWLSKLSREEKKRLYHEAVAPWARGLMNDDQEDEVLREDVRLLDTDYG